jgi:hypothetical protein
MPRNFVQDYFLSRGYNYLLLDNIESKQDGSTIFHYELLNENLIENYYDDMIALDSKLGNEIIQESINGCSVIWIATENIFYINSSGRLFQKQKFQKINFKK